MRAVSNLTEETLEIKFSRDLLFVPFFKLLISKAEFIIGHFADNHIIYYHGTILYRYFESGIKKIKLLHLN